MSFLRLWKTHVGGVQLKDEVVLRLFFQTKKDWVPGDVEWVRDDLIRDFEGLLPVTVQVTSYRG